MNRQDRLAEILIEQQLNCIFLKKAFFLFIFCAIDNDFIQNDLNYIVYSFTAFYYPVAL